MKTKLASSAAFFNLRILIGFVFCSAGLLLALAGSNKSVTAQIVSTPDFCFSCHCAVGAGNLLTGYCLSSTPYGCASTRNRRACPRGAPPINLGTQLCCFQGVCNQVPVDLGRLCTAA